MVTSLSKNRRICLHWLPIWLAFYAGLLVFTPVFPNLITYFKLVAIASNIIFVLIHFHHDQLLILALVLTLLADICLSFNFLPIGTAIFACAQFSHLCRLTPIRKLPPYYIALIMIWLILCLILRLPLITLAAAPYALFLVSNVIFAWCQSARLGIGFTLFLFCDLSVVLSYGASVLILPITIKPLFDYLAWFFYYPSQVLIASTPLSYPIKR